MCIFCILYPAYCAYCAYSGWKSLSLGFHCLLPLLLGPPSQGPAVHVPPPTTITTVCWFIAESSGKVGRFSTHGEGYCPCSTHWNKRKASQYGGHWNHIQNLRLFTAFVDYCGLAHWASQAKVEQQIRKSKICKICRIWPGFLWPLYSSSTET